MRSTNYCLLSRLITTRCLTLSRVDLAVAWLSFSELTLLTTVGRAVAVLSFFGTTVVTTAERAVAASSFLG